MNEQMDIFDLLYEPIKIKNKIRTIELFGGYGSQLLAMKYLGADVEQWKLCEWAVKSIQAYKDVHFENDNKDYSKELTTDEIKQYLYNKGISSNYNEPMTKEQIYRLSEEQTRTIYNNIIATHNLVNIQQVSGESLDIIDKDKYTYLMAYSFPCQDISGAGKGAGFEDTSTRSGMLWEVGRILKECKELNQLPQILMMENVPLIHSQDNMPSFAKWMNQLSELGYKNYWQDLIATDYGIPQTRNRTFMISVLGDYTYKFPKPIKLEKKLKDLLEKDVDEKYYLSDKQLESLENGNYNASKPSVKLETTDKGLCQTSDTMSGGNRQPLIRVDNKSLQETLEQNNIDDTCYIDTYNKRIDKEKSGTITTGVSFRNNTFLAIKDKPKVLGGIGTKDSNNNTQWKQQNRVYDDNVSISITTAFNPYYKNDLRIRKLTPKECARLQGLKDSDTDKILKNQSNASAYHLFGDSICIPVMMALFGQLLDIDWEEKLQELYNEWR